MMKNKIMIIGITLLFLLLSSKTTISFESSYNDILYVDDDGNADYTKIQDAIDNSNPGDTIFVYNGIYHENIIINKTSIQLIGESKHSTIIDGSGFEYVVFVIGRNEILISNFTIRNSSSSGKGIRIGNFLPCLKIIIKNNIISNTSIGIFTPSTLIGFRNNHKSHKIIENEIKNSWNCGINFQVTEFSIIKNNNFIQNKCGINLEWSFGNSIKNNNFIQNEIDVTFDTAFFTKLNNNYYSNHEENYPYLIHGTIFDNKFPWITIDWNPAKEPFNIIS
jgi:nitrous oxidase accessory protein NosD